MPGSVNNGNFILSAYDQLKDKTFADVENEVIHDTEYYYHGREDAPPAKILYVFKPASNPEDHIFARFTNMPHSEQIMRSKMTPFSKHHKDSEEASTHKHGVGDLFPCLYIGGLQITQYIEDGKLFYAKTNLTQDIQRAQNEEELEYVSYGEAKHDVTPFIGDSKRLFEWDEHVLHEVRRMNACHVDVFMGPNFRNHETPFKGFDHVKSMMASIQSAAESAITKSLVEISCIYTLNEEVLRLPYDFYSDMMGAPLRSVGEFPLSPYGLSSTTYACDVDFFLTDTDNAIVFRYKHDEDTEIYGRTTNFSNWETVTDISNYTNPDFRHGHNRISEDVDKFRNECAKHQHRGHPLHLPQNTYAEGIHIVQGKGYQLTPKPIRFSGRGGSNSRNVLFQRRSLNTCTIFTPRANQLINRTQLKALSTIDSPENLILKAYDFVASIHLAARTNYSEDAILTFDKHRFLEGLEKRHIGVQKDSGRTSNQRGNEFERNFGDHVADLFSDITCGDLLVRSKYLPTRKAADFRGIDILGEVNSRLWFAQQCKTGQRISEEEIDSFLRTLKALREDHPGVYILGVLIARKFSPKSVGAKKIRDACQVITLIGNTNDEDYNRLSEEIDYLSMFIKDETSS